MIELMNAQMAGPTEQIGCYALDDQGIILIRRRRSGMVSVMDGASVLNSLGGLSEAILSESYAAVSS